MDLPWRQIDMELFTPRVPPPHPEATPPGTGTFQTRKVSSTELDCHTVSLAAGLKRSNFRVELEECFVYARRHGGTRNSLGRTSTWATFPRSIRRNLIGVPLLRVVNNSDKVNENDPERVTWHLTIAQSRSPPVSSAKYLVSAAFTRPWTVYVVGSKFVLICGQLLTGKTEISVSGIGVISAGFICEESIKSSFSQYHHYLKSRFGDIVF